ncbi:SRPBCC family protein [Halalkalibacter alkalisediminis]|uniref:SRPBCC family protein n=1 Tax=Halalkalibacter alkalisediminis TaxID=935616 RepID=A0ABV6NHE3_9BACI|nr:SRPBCC family protein [Halalkalibacter alkalisediminis]
MKKWTKEIEINAPIEQVWKLLDGSLDDMQKIMPQVVEHRPIKLMEEGVGSIFRQRYKEGKRIEEYDVETLVYLNTPDEKKLKVVFTLANMFEITALYELNKMNPNTTTFKYTVTNRPLKWFVKLFLIFATDKVVVDFLERVKDAAEIQSNEAEKVILGPK